MKKINEREIKEIFVKMREGDKKAFNELYEKYYKLTESIAFSIIKNKENSEDIAQNVFKKILIMDKGKLPTGHEASWLYSVTKNEALQSIRNKKNHFDIDEIYTVVNENDEVTNLIDREKYNKMIMPLNSQEKDIVSLKVLSKFTFNEISQILGIPMGTVQWKYYKSVCTLKLMMSNISMFILTIIVYALNRNARENKETDTQLEKGTSLSEETIDNSQISEETTNKNVNATPEVSSQSDYQTTRKETNQMIARDYEQKEFNYDSAILLTAAGVFLFFSITFSIIFIKHQQKAKVKASK